MYVWHLGVFLGCEVVNQQAKTPFLDPNTCPDAELFTLKALNIAVMTIKVS